MQRRSPPSSQRGLTLLEVLIAFSILAMVLGVVLLGYSHGLRSADHSRDYQRALSIAENRLAEALRESPLQTHTRQGESPPYRWAVIAEPWEAEGEFLQIPQQLYKLRVEVAWGEARQIRHVALESLRLAAPPRAPQ